MFPRAARALGGGRGGGAAPEDLFFEIFQAGHLSFEYRYPPPLRYLAERLQP
jgi:hypothetical protein